MENAALQPTLRSKFPIKANFSTELKRLFKEALRILGSSHIELAKPNSNFGSQPLDIYS